MSEILPSADLERIAALAARTYTGPNKPLRQQLASGWPSEELAWAAVVAVVVAEVDRVRAPEGVSGPEQGAAGGPTAEEERIYGEIKRATVELFKYGNESKFKDAVRAALRSAQRDQGIDNSGQ